MTEFNEQQPRKDSGAAVHHHNKRPPEPGNLWQEWRLRCLYFVGVFVYLELCLHICVFHSIDTRIIYPVFFGATAGLCMCLVCSLLPKLPGRLLSHLLMLAAVIYVEIQLVYYAIFGGFMPVSSLSMGGGVAANFGGQILYGISQNILPIVLIFLPVPVTVLVTIRGKVPEARSRWKQSLATGAVALGVWFIAFCVMFSGRNETFSVYEIFRNVNTSTDTSYKNVGIAATTTQELKYMIFGDQVGDQTLSAVKLDGFTSSSGYNSREYNIMDIDFEALAETTDDELTAALDRYLAGAAPTKKNDYTGMLKDYNLITICAESFAPWLISEELTPTLYELSNSGIIFENYYGSFQNVTTNGEYTMCMGLFPDMSRGKTLSSFDLAGGNYVPFCLGNALGNMGYETFAYHNYIGDFYNRNITHPNMGYTFKAADSGLDIHIDWPSSDLEMMEESVDDYIHSNEPFHAYYMTFSGHYQYTWDNAMSAKNRDKVEGLSYSDPVKAFIACNLELEYALEYLMERLEEEGIADKTVIVLTNDHYPYGLTEQEYDELAGQPIDTTFEKYRNSLICYVPNLPEDIYVEDYCCTADILPTLLNLFGVEYDSRLLAGVDVFSDSPHMAVLYDQSFLSRDFRFDVGTDTLSYSEGVEPMTEEQLGNYRQFVLNKFQLSANILNLDYYSHVFGVEHQEIVEDTVVFDDIGNIFNQASVLYMYRNGYVDPIEERTFGGGKASLIGEFMDVLYRISGRPELGEEMPAVVLEERLMPEDTEYYDAMVWAWQQGLLREEDKFVTPNHRVTFKAAAVYIARFAALNGVDTSIDEAVYAEKAEEYTRLTEEEIRGLVYADGARITNRTGELEEMLENASGDISRYQMTSYLFYLCTYELNMDEQG